MDFVVTGHARSGTKYMSKLLQAYGYDVGHEVVGKDGISSWCWGAPPGPVPYGQEKGEHKYGFLIQVVREPWAVISSCVTTYIAADPATIDFMRKSIELPPPGSPALEMATAMLCRWQDFISRQHPALVVQVEQAPEIITRFLVRHDYEIHGGELPATDTNTRDNSLELDRSGVSKLPSDLRRELNFYCWKYGYTPVVG